MGRKKILYLPSLNRSWFLHSCSYDLFSVLHMCLNFVSFEGICYLSVHCDFLQYSAHETWKLTEIRQQPASRAVSLLLIIYTSCPFLCNLCMVTWEKYYLKVVVSIAGWESGCISISQSWQEGLCCHKICMFSKRDLRDFS
jgi:hypothetical protein